MKWNAEFSPSVALSHFKCSWAHVYQIGHCREQGISTITGSSFGRTDILNEGSSRKWAKDLNSSNKEKEMGKVST